MHGAEDINALAFQSFIVLPNADLYQVKRDKGQVANLIPHLGTMAYTRKVAATLGGFTNYSLRCVSLASI